MTDSNFKVVVGDYLSEVQEGIALFKDKIGDTHPLSAWRNDGLPQKGQLSDDVRYEFHGVGCLLVFPEYEVDFDFGPDGRIDGFDLWRLGLYVESRPDKYPYYKDSNVLKKDFELAVKKELIGKLDGPHCNLYYCQ